jgi:hypothetical protein
MTRNRLNSPFGLCLMLLLAVFAAALPVRRPVGQARPAPASQDRDGRLAPPARLDCPRDNTTSFTGRVLSYSRGAGRVRLRLRTDEETTEQFTLAYGKSDPRRFFLLRGERFETADWRKIETRAGRLRPGMRVTVWACYVGADPQPRLFDWRPRAD